MTEEERVDSFLASFKELEKELAHISRIKDDYVSFSRALNQIYYNRLNPIIAQRDNYDFLKTASDLRNILSHENNVCAPSESFLERFQKIGKAILSPYDCYDVCTKDVDTCVLSTPVFEAMERMVKNGLSHLPVVNAKGQVIGVFSRSTLFDFLQGRNKMELDASYTIQDFRSAVSFDGHLNEDFFFVPRHRSVVDAFGMILKKKAHDKQVGLLLVTENGRKTEKLLGVITALDLAKLSRVD